MILHSPIPTLIRTGYEFLGFHTAPIGVTIHIGQDDSGDLTVKSTTSFLSKGIQKLVTGAFEFDWNICFVREGGLYFLHRDTHRMLKAFPKEKSAPINWWYYKQKIKFAIQKNAVKGHHRILYFKYSYGALSSSCRDWLHWTSG